MRFDPTISLGNLIQGGLFIAACIGGIIKFGKLEQRVETMHKWFEHNIINAAPMPKQPKSKPNGRYPLGLN